MTNEDQHLDENDKSTLDETRESEESSEFDFEALLSEDENEDSKEVPVTREEFNRLLKGVQKLATKTGREQKQVDKVEKTVETTSKVDETDDVSELFFEQKPQAELVSDDLKAVAKAKYGGSILKAWKNEAWIQTKAQALADEKKADEENKTKISKPSSGVSPSRNDFSHVKSDDDVAKMSSKERAAFMKQMAAKGN